MKIIIFAGGIGTRLWPMSRKNSPKQFEKIFNGKSTLELAIERIEPLVGMKNIYIQTTEEFKEAIRAQVSSLPEENIFIEPMRRNVGPAVCYGMFKLKNANKHELEHEITRTEPVALLWADHLMENVEEFRNALRHGEKLILENPKRFIFLAERPRFANNNLGWIYVGEKSGEIDGEGNTFPNPSSERRGREYFKFLGWKYRPGTDECERMFKSGDYFWNPGYFISSIDFILNQYKELSPEIYGHVKNAVLFPGNAKSHYSNAEKITFDQAVIEKTDLSDAVILKTDMGWSDPGTLYGLKEALTDNEDDNVTKGKVLTMDTRDSLIYNFDEHKLLTTVGLDGFVVINTEDSIIVAPKDEVVHITKLVEKIEEEGYGKHL